LVRALALGYLGMHPWEFERYTGHELLRKLQGLQWLENKRYYSQWDVGRNIMAQIANWAGKSLKKGVSVKPHEIVRLPHDKLAGKKKIDFNKLWEKHKPK
jgi:hypothetical protein